jgi:hypothetical protein
MNHPVTYDVDYEIERNRLTVFFRLILAIPWIIFGYVYLFVAFLAAIGSWFAMLFTGRHPEGLYNFIAGYIRFMGRVMGWIALATDEWPSFGPSEDDAYPIEVEVAPRQVEYSRAKTFFKLILAFPQIVIANGLQYVVQGAAFVTWWRVLFTGKQSVTMHGALRVSLAYYMRSMGFMLMLTETHPRVLDLPAQQLPADAPGMPNQQLETGTPPPPTPPPLPAQGA